MRDWQTIGTFALIAVIAGVAIAMYGVDQDKARKQLERQGLHDVTFGDAYWWCGKHQSGIRFSAVNEHGETIKGEVCDSYWQMTVGYDD